jgi:hypothetical protein
VLSIREYLDAPLRPCCRVTDLAALCVRVVQSQPLAGALDAVRAEITERTVTPEAYRRLHVLLSHLYHVADQGGQEKCEMVREHLQTVYELLRSHDLVAGSAGVDVIPRAAALRRTQGPRDRHPGRGR